MVQLANSFVPLCILIMLIKLLFKTKFLPYKPVVIFMGRLYLPRGHIMF
jgi:hypothetical protein